MSSRWSKLAYQSQEILRGSPSLFSLLGRKIKQAKQVGPKAKEAYLPGWLLWYNQIKSMVAKIGVVICVLAAILLYGTGILFWLAIISTLTILVAGFAGAYIVATPELRKTEATACQMESAGCSDEEIIAFMNRPDGLDSHEFDPILTYLVK